MSSRISFLFLAGFLATTGPLPTAAASEVDYPDDFRGKTTRLYFEAFNDPGTDLMRDFILGYRSESALARTPIEARLARLGQMRGMLGTIDPRTITRDTAHSLAFAAFSEKSGMWFSFAFDFEEASPHKVALITIQPTGDPNENAVDLGRAESLADMLAIVIEETSIPGIAAAFVTRDGVMESAAHGVRVAGKSTPVEVSDPFHIGSVTKSMTATVVGTLIEDGVIKLSDTLGMLLPDTPMNDMYKDVTLMELLGHRAGLPSFTSDDEVSAFTAPEGTPPEQRAAFAGFLLQQEPFVEPGRSFQYSNAGYSIAAHITEVVSGTSWEVLLKERVFAPLDMKKADLGWPATPAKTHRPRGHHVKAGLVRPQRLDDSYFIPPYLAPAGDVHCSAPGLARYALMHLRGLLGTGDILEAETIRALHTPDPSWGTDGYAGGWIIETVNGNEIHRHGGSAETFYGLVEVDVTAGVAGVVLMNSGDMGNDQWGGLIIKEFKKRLKSD